jgi:hypothetical protein
MFVAVRISYLTCSSCSPLEAKCSSPRAYKQLAKIFVYLKIQCLAFYKAYFTTTVPGFNTGRLFCIPPPPSPRNRKANGPSCKFLAKTYSTNADIIRFIINLTKTSRNSTPVFNFLFKLRFNVTFPSTQKFPKICFVWCFPTEILYAFLTYPCFLFVDISVIATLLIKTLKPQLV